MSLQKGWGRRRCSDGLLPDATFDEVLDHHQHGREGRVDRLVESVVVAVRTPAHDPVAGRVEALFLDGSEDDVPDALRQISHHGLAVVAVDDADPRRLHVEQRQAAELDDPGDEVHERSFLTLMKDDLARKQLGVPEGLGREARAIGTFEVLVVVQLGDHLGAVDEQELHLAALVHDRQPLFGVATDVRQDGGHEDGGKELRSFLAGQRTHEETPLDAASFDREN